MSDPAKEKLTKAAASYCDAAGIHFDGRGHQSRMSELFLPGDAVITALTQAGPLRLQCDRAFTSLIGQQWQYIISESTPTLPYRQEKFTETDQLCLGVMSTSEPTSMCLHAMKYFIDVTGKHAWNDSNTQADHKRLHIRDLRKDPVFCANPLVTSWPHIRSYLAVPLRTSTGLVIGSYSAVDSNVRDDFDENATLIMAEIAQNIMDYLGLRKTKQLCERAERLINGLSVFVEDCSSLRGSPQDNHRTPARAVPLNGSNQASPNYLSPGSSDAEIFCTPSPSSASDADLPDRQGDPRKFGLGEAPSPDLPPPKPSPLPRDSKIPFLRAASLIREGTSIEGLIFLDACPAGFGALRSTNSRPNADTSPGTAAEEANENSIACEILGYSTGSQTAPIHQDFKVSEALLQRLIRSNPCGRLIHADEQGQISCGARPADENAGRQGERANSERQASKDDIEQLLHIIPQARSLLFLPLWDYHRSTWHAAAIGWTTDPMHSFAEGDMAYISAFSNSIMIEVARLDALVTSAAKGDFISSISHELRSPLHGIMASAELLDETPQDPDQRQLIAMIKSCATTLIDTTAHLLDYAKINSLVKDDRRPPPHHASSSSSEAPPDSALSSEVDLARLVEEVVEGAYVGHAAQASTKLWDKDHHADNNEDAGKPPGNPPVLVTVDIEKRAGWHLRTEAGAWRRIVMNVFGNALKYTARGSIVAALRTVATPAGGTDIRFSVRDTGCGMSADYLRRQLFTPYAQENPLSAGVGLGLSIVRHLVRELHGTVSVESTRGVGTLIGITIPTSSSRPLHEAAAAAAVVAAAAGTDRKSRSVEALRGKAVTVLELDAAGNSLLPAFMAMAKTWLGVDVLTTIDAALELERGDAAAGMPLIVLCNSAPTARQKLTAMFQNATFIVQPFGPRKLEWTITTVFARHAARGEQEPREKRKGGGEAGGGEREEGKRGGGEGGGKEKEKEAGGDPTRPPLTRSTELSVSTPTTRLDSATTATKASLAAATILPPPQQRPPPHILVVDDNSVNRKILTTYLTKLRCTYQTASNGLEAVEAWRAAAAAVATRQPFEYVFMDMSMPVMDGFEATREIRADERCARVRRCHIVALTGLGASCSQREAFASGADTYLMKPVPLAKLKELVLGKRGVA